MREGTLSKLSIFSMLGKCPLRQLREMRYRNLIESFNSAIEGFIFVFKTQRNMRLHFLVGVGVLLSGIFLHFTYIELVILSITISFVLISEMFNTAVEHTIDLVKEEFHPLARIVKDICAGAVLLSAFTAVIVGYLLFASRFGAKVEENVIRVRDANWHITFIILLIILSMVILSKLLLHSGTPLRGGMPSGHTSVAFSIWTLISLFYPDSLIIFLVFILAFFVSRSRVKERIHSVSEVFTGALLGVVITLFIFQLLKR